MPTSQGDPRRREGHGARNEGERLVIVANPNAGAGRAGRARDAIERAAARAFANVEVRWTERPGHASELAREAALGGADLVAALGGDGTCNEVVRGLVTETGTVNPATVFTTLPFGTGGDLVRTLEMPRALADALWIASTGTTVHVDVGQVHFGDAPPRAFINVAGVGANADVCVRVNGSAKRLGGTLTFLGAILATVREFTPVPTRWRWRGPEGDGEAEVPTLAAFVANAHYCGAGLWVGKGGSMADGLFDVSLVPALSFSQALRGLPHTRTGELERIPGVVRFKASEISFESQLPVETDGEPQGAGPARFTRLPRALQVRGAWRTPPIPL